MLAEKIAVNPAKRRERGPGARLCAEVMALSEGCATIVSRQEAAWASITFTGKRHTLRVVFDGPLAAEAGERMIAALPDHEFTIPGQLVADATVREVDHRLLPDERLEVAIDVLMLDEG